MVPLFIFVKCKLLDSHHRCIFVFLLLISHFGGLGPLLLLVNVVDDVWVVFTVMIIGEHCKYVLLELGTDRDITCLGLLWTEHLLQGWQ